MPLSKKLDTVQWFGRGPHENYVDRKQSSFIGHYTRTISEFYFPYIRPQENGNRTDTSWASLTDSNGVGLMFAGNDKFEFSALQYSTNAFDGTELGRYRHSNSLTKSEQITFNLNHKQMGVGGDTSWGAKPHPQYRIPAKSMSYKFRLLPIDLNKHDLIKRSKQTF